MMPVMMGAQNLEQYDVYKDILYIGEAIIQTSAKWLMKVQGRFKCLFQKSILLFKHCKENSKK